ncbi:MAG: hypothetical protein IPM29_17765 [Planctomycetes bacterium]|nr:hypothetical protein [Planctomycetota bacterium]
MLWWGLGHVTLPAALRRTLVDGPPGAADTVLRALLAGGLTDLPHILAELLATGTQCEARLAIWFADHPDPAMRSLLGRRLAVHPADSSVAIVLRETLDAIERAGERGIGAATTGR